MRIHGLGELELPIMEFVWAAGQPVTVPEVHGHLSASRELAYTTVMTVMSRLHEKGLLDRDEERRPYRYCPDVTREDYFADLLVGVLADVSDRQSVLARFVDRISNEDARLLRALVARTRRQKR